MAKETICICTVKINGNMSDLTTYCEAHRSTIPCGQPCNVKVRGVVGQYKDNEISLPCIRPSGHTGVCSPYIPTIDNGGLPTQAFYNDDIETEYRSQRNVYIDYRCPARRNTPNGVERCLYQSNHKTDHEFPTSEGTVPRTKAERKALGHSPLQGHLKELAEAIVEPVEELPIVSAINKQNSWVSLAVIDQGYAYAAVITIDRQGRMWYKQVSELLNEAVDWHHVPGPFIGA